MTLWETWARAGGSRGSFPGTRTTRRPPHDLWQHRLHQTPPIIPTPTEELLFPLVQVATEIQNQSTQRLGEHPGAGQRLGPQPWAAKTQTCIRDGRGQAPQNTALRSGVQAALRIPRMSGTAPGTPGSPLAMYLHLLSFLLCRVGSPFLVPGSWSLVALLSPARLAAPCSSCSQKSHCSIS